MTLPRFIPGSLVAELEKAKSSLDTTANGAFASLPADGAVPVDGNGVAVVDVPDGASLMVVTPYMTSATAKGMISKAVGFRSYRNSDGVYYTRNLLWSMGSIVSGASASYIGADHFTADTITPASDDPGFAEVQSPEDGEHDAVIIVNPRGASKVALYMQKAASNAADGMGFLVGWL